MENFYWANSVLAQSELSQKGAVEDEFEISTVNLLRALTEGIVVKETKTLIKNLSFQYDVDTERFYFKSTDATDGQIFYTKDYDDIWVFKDER